MALLGSELKGKFRRVFFPFTAENLGLFAFFWLFLGFSTGLSTLFGPVRWTANFVQTHDLNYDLENRIVKVIIVGWVVISALIASWFVRIWRKPGQKWHLRISMVLFVLASGISALLFMLYPSYFGEITEIKATGERVIFGGYPNKEQMIELKDQRFEAIIALLDPSLLPEKALLDREINHAKEVGIRLIHIPMIPWVGEETNKQAFKVFQDIFEKYPLGRFYIHCYLGRDRIFIAKRFIQKIDPTLFEIEKLGMYPLERVRHFLRGDVIQLGGQAFLVPSPTKSEFFSYLGKMPNLVSILDPALHRDRGVIQKEKELAEQISLPYQVFPVPSQTIDPYQVLGVVKEIKELEKPTTIEVDKIESPRTEIFKTTYVFEKPSIAPSLFQPPMQPFLPNVVIGPRPEEFSSLYENGIRSVLFLGSENREDEREARRAGLNFISHDGRWIEKVDQGGPWYVYGPNLKIEPLPIEKLDLGVYLSSDGQEIEKLYPQEVFFLAKKGSPKLLEQQKRLFNLKIPFETLEVKTSPFPSEEILDFAKKVWRAKRPVVIQVVEEENSTLLVEAVKQAFFTSEPSLPPALFRESLQGGFPRVLAPNIVAGPRPTKEEFSKTLREKGIKGFIYLGYPNSSIALEDQEYLNSQEIPWFSLDPDLDSFYEFIINGGPWYLYGKALTEVIMDRVERRIGPAIPDRIFYYPNLLEKPQKAVLSLEKHISLRKILSGKIPWSLILPSPKTLVLLGPVMILYILFWASYVGNLRTQSNVSVAYTRKIFHFTIFTAAGFFQLQGGFPVVALFGGLVSLAVLYALFRGKGFGLYEAMARPNDDPLPRFFIFVPLFMTALGGLLNNIFFGVLAVLGIFVAGFGDAVAEVVGKKWGRHFFVSPSPFGVVCRKTIEGSVSILIVSALVAMFTLIYLGVATISSFYIGLAIGFTAVVVEALTPHGFDNLTVQLSVAGVAYLLLNYL